MEINYLHWFLIVASYLIIPCIGAGRVLGGNDADIEKHPYQLSMELNGKHMCGAAIIGPTWVLTAGHCVHEKELNEVQFRAGTSFKHKDGSLHPAKKFYIHPDFKSKPVLRYDIAVVEVSEPFVYGAKVEAIPLALREPKHEELSTITGWGAISKDEKNFPEQLQVASIPIVDRQICDNDYKKYGGIYEDMLCAGPGKDDSDACRDDSGGPLVLRRKIVGIVSFGHGCANTKYPGVYANVPHLRKFVYSITGDLDDQSLL